MVLCLRLKENIDTLDYHQLCFAILYWHYWFVINDWNAKICFAIFLFSENVYLKKTTCEHIKFSGNRLFLCSDRIKSSAMMLENCMEAHFQL